MPDFTKGLEEVSNFASQPLKGKKIGRVTQTMGDGVDPAVHDAVESGLRHLESLGASISEVCAFRCSMQIRVRRFVGSLSESWYNNSLLQSGCDLRPSQSLVIWSTKALINCRRRTSQQLCSACGSDDGIVTQCACSGLSGVSAHI